jgi:hypothetical protein
VRIEEPLGLFSSLPLPSGAAFSPKNVMRIDDFYRDFS